MRRLIQSCFLIALVATTACGDDSTHQPRGPGSESQFGGDQTDNDNADGSEPTEELDCLSGEGLSGSTVSGRVYLDQDVSDLSHRAQSFDVPIDEPLPELSVSLLGGTSEVTGVTCADGTFAYGELVEGSYLLDFGLDAGTHTTSKNRSFRLPEAVRSGTVRVVAFGDSLPIVGDDTPFPARLAEILAELATVESVNVAVGGSVSTEWLPGTPYFEDRLLPVVADADLILISLGGNDAAQYLFGAFTDGRGIDTALAELDEAVEEVKDNVMSTIAAIREVNPAADVVYTIYPNYAESDAWRDVLPGLADVLSGALQQALEQVRESIAPEDDLVLIDLYALMQLYDLDDYLADQLHLNAEGHALVAREIFEVLGGAWVGPNAYGLEHNVGVTAP